MARTIRVEHHYATTPQKVWEAAKQFDDLPALSAGSVQYRGLPTEPVKQGDVIEFEVQPFYTKKWNPYKVTMAEVNDAERRFVSVEEGAGVKEWRHTMRVVPDGDGAKQIDEITIDAGLMTWPISLMAKRMYKSRDAPRRKILGLA